MRSRRSSHSIDDNALRSSSCDAYGHRCVSGSTCIPTVDSSRSRYSDNTGYTCLCPPGLTGTYCQDDIDECLNNQCQNGATCVNSHGSFSCVCVNGWTVSIISCLIPILLVFHHRQLTKKRLKVFLDDFLPLSPLRISKNFTLINLFLFGPLFPILISSTYLLNHYSVSILTSLIMVR